MACCHGTVEPPASEVSIAFAQTVASFIILEGLEQVEEQTPALLVADQVFITTSGVGVIPAGRNLRAERVQPGDVAIVNGVLGDHGAAILAARGDMALSVEIPSDCQPLNDLMAAACAAAGGARETVDRSGIVSVS